MYSKLTNERFLEYTIMIQSLLLRQGLVSNTSRTKHLKLSASLLQVPARVSIGDPQSREGITSEVKAYI